MRVGEEIIIYVNAEFLNQILSKNSTYLWTLFFFTGLILLISAISIVLISIKKKKFNKRLLTDGTKVYAEISEVTINTTFSMNHRHPFVIICKWIDPLTGLFYFYKSGSIWFNPQPILKDKGIDHLAVYIDKENPKNYFVSLYEIEKFLGNL